MPQSEHRMASWAFGVEDCSATLITSRIALTTSRCADRAKFPVGGAALSFTQRRTGTTFPGQVVMHAQLSELPPSGLALIELRASSDTGTKGAPIASYVQEAGLLKDPKPGATREQGRRLYAFATSRVDGYAWVHGVGARDRSFDNQRLPLTYRSLARLKSTERGRFQRSGLDVPWDDLLGERVQHALRGWNDPSADALLIPLAGTITDGMTHRRRPPPMPGWGQMSSPFQSGDEGSGLLATARPAGDLALDGKLVGLTGGDGLLHMRLSAHWPAIYRAMIEQGWREDAAQVAAQVLNLKAFDEARTGKPGQFYALANPSTNDVEFFRLRRVDADGTYPARPSHGQGDDWWEFLGTDLPSRAEVMERQAKDRTAAKAAGKAAKPAVEGGRAS
ncbi:hypothetical protein [Roseateles sp. L2-2]|uniref:hypothetical protein n=1 Tax=Roseateles sp. L2-2 TaxID=3422597 RepID=UPI003D366C71